MRGVETTPAGTFRARIRLGAKFVTLGTFGDKDDAGACYMAALSRRDAGLPLRDEVAYGPLSERDSLQQNFSYDAESGLFTHKRVANKVRSGKIAGSVGNHGYLTLSLGKRRYLAHRVAWLFTHGEWPAQMIDHINRVKTDNRIVNLREATRTQNLWNTRPRKSNSGFKGVATRLGGGYTKRYRAKIKVNGRLIALGDFQRAEDAHAAYAAAALKHFGEFANTK